MKIESSNYQAIVVKLMFLFSYAAAASWLTYFYVYLKEVPKLSSLEIGVIAGIQQFNFVFVVPVWGFLADRFGRKNTLLVSVGATLLLLPVFLVLKGDLSLTLYMFLITLFYNPLTSLLDTVALDYEEQSAGKTSFGEIRLWASIGWAGSSLLTGVLINHTSLDIIYPLSSLFFLVVLVVIWAIYKPLQITKNISSIKPNAIKQLLKTEKKLMLFFILIFFYSLFTAPIYLMINVYYHEIGASSSIIGLAFFVQAMCELPFFFYGKRIVSRFGPLNVFLFTMLATALRLFAYGFNNDPLVAVGIGVIHGISIGLFFVSMVAFVHKIVPQNLRSTGQSLIYTFYSAGVAFGNLLTGFVDDYLSISWAMIINGTAVVGIVFFVLFRRTVINNRYK